MNQVITANRLRDGAVVFRAADGSWLDRIDGAEVWADAQAAKAGVAASEPAVLANDVLDVYAVEVTVKGDTITPIRLREQIRATGPTVHPEHGKVPPAPAAPSQMDPPDVSI